MNELVEDIEMSSEREKRSTCPAVPNAQDEERMRSRYYNPGLGRFLSVDPLAHKMPSWSPFGYTFNNPLRFTDPTGMEPEQGGGCDDCPETTLPTVFVTAERPENWSEADHAVSRQLKSPVLRSVVSKYATDGIPISDPRGVYQNVGNSLSSTGDTYEGVMEAVYWAGVLTSSVLPFIGAVDDGGAAALGLFSKFSRASRAANTSTKLLCQFAKSTIDDAVVLTMKQKGNHIFANKLHPKPYLNQLAHQMGGRENVIRAALQNANGRFPTSGVIEDLPVNVGGMQLYIKGFINNGKPIINSLHNGSLW